MSRTTTETTPTSMRETYTSYLAELFPHGGRDRYVKGTPPEGDTLSWGPGYNLNCTHPRHQSFLTFLSVIYAINVLERHHTKDLKTIPPKEKYEPTLGWWGKLLDLEAHYARELFPERTPVPATEKTLLNLMTAALVVALNTNVIPTNDQTPADIKALSANQSTGQSLEALQEAENAFNAQGKMPEEDYRDWWAILVFVAIACYKLHSIYTAVVASPESFSDAEMTLSRVFGLNLQLAVWAVGLSFAGAIWSNIDLKTGARKKVNSGLQEISDNTRLFREAATSYTETAASNAEQISTQDNAQQVSDDGTYGCPCKVQGAQSTFF